MSKYLIGFLLGFAYLGGMVLAWRHGTQDGINEVVSSCSYYTKYAIDGTQVLLCSAVVNTQDLENQTEQHIYHPYKKEDVIRDRNKRK